MCHRILSSDVTLLLYLRNKREKTLIFYNLKRNLKETAQHCGKGNKAAETKVIS